MDIIAFADEVGTNALVIGMVCTALYSAYTRRLAVKINSYRLQTLALSFLAMLKTNVNTNLLFYGVALILLIQFLIIARILAFITNLEKRKPDQSWFSALLERANVEKARSVWLEYNPEHNPNTKKVRPSSLRPLIISTALVFVAYFVASQVAQGRVGVPDLNGLGASLALLLVGLFTMINSYDTLSQTMGLLVMENGLFLAAVIVITDQFLVFAFLVSMFAWYMLTLVILVRFLPRLRQSSDSIYVEDQKVLKE